MIALKKQKPHTVQESLRSGVMTLQKAHIESASLDARILLEHVMGCTREKLMVDMKHPLPSQTYAKYQTLIAARAKRHPVSHLIGAREFWGQSFKVTPDTLDPRPDSETLIEAVIARFPDKNAKLTVVDLGTGTGCLLLTLLKEYPHMMGVGVEKSEAALSVAKENAMALGLGSRARFVCSRWFEQVEGQFDIVVSNPPYIATKDMVALAPEVALYEPKLALDGGIDGLDCYRELLPAMREYMKAKAVAFFEIGMGQQRDIEAIADKASLKVEAVASDLGGIPRCVIMKKI
jgi:release factor glutamine methyltransferase